MLRSHRQMEKQQLDLVPLFFLVESFAFPSKCRLECEDRTVSYVFQSSDLSKF